MIQMFQCRKHQCHEDTLPLLHFALQFSKVCQPSLNHGFSIEHDRGFLHPCKRLVRPETIQSYILPPPPSLPQRSLGVPAKDLRRTEALTGLEPREAIHTQVCLPPYGFEWEISMSSPNLRSNQQAIHRQSMIKPSSSLVPTSMSAGVVEPETVEAVDGLSHLRKKSPVDTSAR